MILFLLGIIFRKHKKGVLCFALIVVIVEGIGVYFILKEGATNAVTKTTFASNKTNLTMDES